ncbi:MAG: hypothetical protein OEW58_08520 [Gammaproteobacteria bacterium]|nr:hypothetical protein [Gammaproteobacteria bacterium]
MTDEKQVKDHAQADIADKSASKKMSGNKNEKPARRDQSDDIRIIPSRRVWPD